VVRLQAQGLTHRQLGEQLGLTTEAVRPALRQVGGKQFTVRCCRCHAAIWTGRPTVAHNGDVLSLACLSRTPDASFGQRLKAARLAAGLTQQELGEQPG
jgi:hypothetical protein